MLMLRDYGTLGVRDVLEPAIFYAEHGHPLLPRVAETIADMADFFREEWPTSAERCLPGGTAPAAGALVCHQVLAEPGKQVVRGEEATSSDERRAGRGCGRTGCSRCYAYHEHKNKTKISDRAQSTKT